MLYSLYTLPSQGQVGRNGIAKRRSHFIKIMDGWTYGQTGQPTNLHSMLSSCMSATKKNIANPFIHSKDATKIMS